LELQNPIIVLQTFSKEKNTITAKTSFEHSDSLNGVADTLAHFLVVGLVVELVVELVVGLVQTHFS